MRDTYLLYDSAAALLYTKFEENVKILVQGVNLISFRREEYFLC
jgi:hypothetical protein